jgi:hypothetical protein
MFLIINNELLQKREHILQTISKYKSSFSGLWRKVVLWYDTTVSEVHPASIFRVKRWYPTTTLQDVTTQKTMTRIFTAVKTSYQAFSKNVCFNYWYPIGFYSVLSMMCLSYLYLCHIWRWSDLMKYKCGRPGSIPGRDFFLRHCIQTDSGVHPASYTLGTGGSFPGGKAVGAWSYTSIPPICLHGMVLN